MPKDEMEARGAPRAGSACDRLGALGRLGALHRCGALVQERLVLRVLLEWRVLGAEAFDHGPAET
eukprot:12381438-Alexandrium_andersonii.AAC.1